jgi:hypothetical protein
MRLRKVVTMLVTVTARGDLTAADVRREVRTLVNERCFYSADIEEGDLKVTRVAPATLPPRRKVIGV